VQDTAEEVILRRSQGAAAANVITVAGAASSGDVTDRRVLRNELLVSLRRVAIADDGAGSLRTAT
jgi:hypothetical protein